ncbi:hypothetical protein D3C87_299010 [compost metagenome]
MNRITIKFLKQLAQNGYSCLIAKGQAGMDKPIYYPFKEIPSKLIPALSSLPFEEDQFIIIKDAIENLTDEDLTGVCVLAPN